MLLLERADNRVHAHKEVRIQEVDNRGEVRVSITIALPDSLKDDIL